ncbi:MAG: hypothetical protein BRD55_02150 [Bacteroidetes bacterium SW_9_63_38]|nr:MAG: hypothetical protein BRD55_02150 [Bacteroidetes bacterium SW_9_63_38]
MPNFYLPEAASLLLKTIPILWVRIGSYALLWLGLLVYAAVVGGVAWLLSQLWSVLGIIVVLAAFAGAFGIVRWVTRYYFYLLKAAHAAVMTEYIVHGMGPEGSQGAHGTEQVLSRFKDTSIMFAIDQILDAVVTSFNRASTRVTDWLPVPGMDSLQAFIQRVSRFSTTYIDEAILSRAYEKKRTCGRWPRRRDSLCPVLEADSGKCRGAHASQLRRVLCVPGPPGRSRPGDRVSSAQPQHRARHQCDHTDP